MLIRVLTKLKRELFRWSGRKLHYLAALKVVHNTLKPRNYFEIGCYFGNSLKLANCSVIGVDPNMRLQDALKVKAELFEETSDAFFANHDPREIFGEPIHLSFIDGMHHAEFALRDFINAEKLSGADGLIMLDDVLPEHIDFAGRKATRGAWCGDVYKTLRIIRKFRPDLQIHVFDVAIKGLGIISNLDPSSTVLVDNYEKIEAEILDGGYVVDDVETLRKEFKVQSCTKISKTLAGLI